MPGGVQVMYGPVVDQATAMFDLYWNSTSVLPIAWSNAPRTGLLVVSWMKSGAGSVSMPTSSGVSSGRIDASP